MEELNNENVGMEGTEGVKATDLQTAEEPKGLVKKVIKWTIRGLVIAASVVTGFLLGRSTGNHDDDSNEEATDEAA